MASTEWIESAWQAGRRKPPKGDGFIDRKAQHILGGAYTYEQAELHRAARYVARQVPDLGPATVMDQLTVMVYDLFATQPDAEVTDVVSELSGIRHSL